MCEGKMDKVTFGRAKKLNFYLHCCRCSYKGLSNYFTMYKNFVLLNSYLFLSIFKYEVNLCLINVVYYSINGCEFSYK